MPTSALHMHVIILHFLAGAQPKLPCIASCHAETCSHTGVTPPAQGSLPPHRGHSEAPQHVQWEGPSTRDRDHEKNRWLPLATRDLTDPTRGYHDGDLTTHDKPFTYASSTPMARRGSQQGRVEHHDDTFMCAGRQVAPRARPRKHPPMAS
jgi:hypothetical protein